MNKSDLIKAAAARTGLSQSQAGAVLDAALDVIAEQVAEGEKVKVMGFGVWESRQRKARSGRNPQTGERMEIPAEIVPVFVAGKAFRDRVARSES